MRRRSKAAAGRDAGEAREFNFDPIKPKRVFEEIVGRIRDEIAAGVLRPGDKLPPERALAEKLGVSRMALREALRSLENAGLIGLRKGPKGGAFILEGNPTIGRSIQDMVDLGRITLTELSEARLFLQEIVVRLACERATEADYRALEQDIERTEELARAGRLRERLSYSIQFYSVLAAATHNNALVVLIDALTRILRVLIARLGPAPRQDLVQTRRRFLAHMRVGDVEAAIDEMTHHLNTIHRHLALEQRRALRRARRSRQASS
jgi:DNA-binding FadR family transcriptional regulator